MPPCSSAAGQTLIDITPRSFTGHEHVDSMGLIHMNGRIYDAQLGRFLQADPFIEDTSTLNRYTYVHNNPLAYTDPSGYLSRSVFGRALAFIGTVIGAYIGGPIGYVIAAASAFTGTYIATGTLRSAFTSAALAVVAIRVGELTAGAETTASGGEQSLSGASGGGSGSEVVQQTATRTLPTPKNAGDAASKAANAGPTANQPLVTSTPETAILRDIAITGDKVSLVNTAAFDTQITAMLAYEHIVGLRGDPTIHEPSRQLAQDRLADFLGIRSGEVAWAQRQLYHQLMQLGAVANGFQTATETIGGSFVGGPGGRIVGRWLVSRKALQTVDETTHIVGRSVGAQEAIFKGSKVTNELARQLDIPRRKLGGAVERLKRGSGLGGADNVAIGRATGDVYDLRTGEYIGNVYDEIPFVK